MNLTASNILNFIANTMCVKDGGGCKFEISFDDATRDYIIAEKSYGENKRSKCLGYGRSLGEAFEMAILNQRE